MMRQMMSECLCHLLVVVEYASNSAMVKGGCELSFIIVSIHSRTSAKGVVLSSDVVVYNQLVVSMVYTGYCSTCTGHTYGII